MKLAAIAYPELNNADFELIQHFRKNNDDQFRFVHPHFTFVFPIDGIEPNDFKTEISLQLKDIRKIPFSLERAMINKDAFSNNFHVFLVPDKGLNAMVKLHDKLYSDKLFGSLRKDIPFIPHITIANSTDKFIGKKIADEWNTRNIKVEGTISAIDIVDIQTQQIITIEKFKLK